MKVLIGIMVGFVGGWAIRSIAESSHGVGVELMSVALKTKDQVEGWAAAEFERVSDIAAEARSRLDEVAGGVKSSQTHGSVH